MPPPLAACWTARAMQGTILPRAAPLDSRGFAPHDAQAAAAGWEGGEEGGSAASAAAAAAVSVAAAAAAVAGRSFQGLRQ
eukprot:1153934-Pelagomonas_calceolata.AAC.1